MRTWFTSDHHFGHENIIRYCGRPYRNAGEMNFDMRRRWNDVVGPNDTVYYLGDFAMGPTHAWSEFRRRLHGRIILIRGNHDRAGDYMVKQVGFAEAHENIVVEVDGVQCWLNHYPPAVDGEEDHRGRRDYTRPEPPGPYDIALCGHIHQLWQVRDGVVNVGVDVWDYRPISLADISSGRESSSERQ
jgi:calcineurin-like phosphoesterase family protein